MTQPVLLVVDDDAVVGWTCRIGLRGEPIAVVTCALGREALAQIREQRPSAVVLDVMLPDIDGAEVCRALRRDPATRELPIVLLSAKDRVELKAIALACGADYYLTKPFAPRELFAWVREQLAVQAMPPVALAVEDYALR